MLVVASAIYIRPLHVTQEPGARGEGALQGLLVKLDNSWPSLSVVPSANHSSPRRIYTNRESP